MNGVSGPGATSPSTWFTLYTKQWNMNIVLTKDEAEQLMSLALNCIVFTVVKKSDTISLWSICFVTLSRTGSGSEVS